jgi:hypothetical protein
MYFVRTALLSLCFGAGVVLSVRLVAWWPQGPLPLLLALGLVCGGAVAGLVPVVRRHALALDAVLERLVRGGVVFGVGLALWSLASLRPGLVAFDVPGFLLVLGLAAALGLGTALLAHAVFLLGVWATSALGDRLRPRSFDLR